MYKETQMRSLKTIDDFFAYVKKAPVTETKANENVDITQNSAWYSAAGVKNSIKDMTAKVSPLLSRLTEGYEGANLPDSYPIPYDITNYFMKGKAAWTDSAVPAVSATQVTSNSSTLTQVSFIHQINVTDEMLDNCTDEELYNKLVSILSKTSARTIEDCIINGDSETGATSNVNSDDQAPATTFGSAQYHSLKIDHGLRESAINNSKTVDVSAFDSDDMITVQNLLSSQYLEDPSQLLWLFEPKTKNVAMTDDAFKLAVNNSRPAVEGGLPAPWGTELLVSSLVPTTEADGKVSATPANNTKGQFICFYKPAVRWGFGKELNIESTRVAGFGYTLTATMRFGFVILDAANVVAVGRNVTIS